MSVKHCPKIAEPRNLGFYECNGVEAVALGAHVVQDTGQAGALIIGSATVGITPQGLYYMEEHDLPRLYNRNAGGRAFNILPDGQKAVVLFKKEGDRRPYYNLTLYYYNTGELEAVDLGYPPEWILKNCLGRVSITATASSTFKTRYTIWE
uniref:Uncharacterized protein n=1 Tax=Podoviridae sp. ct2iq11 TaxID=2827720 RepID=A0A8S5TPH8_9CAUD|nr:MAG TPA: hypothetical protein [Podoviridae sp. ct2iq11]